MQPKIAVVGSLNMDLIVRAPRLPRPGETLIGHSIHIAPGGKGANQAVAAARLGAAVAMIGRVGEDPYGQMLLRTLDEAHIEAQHVITDPEAATGVALIAVDDLGQNNIIIVSGANMRLTGGDMEAAEDSIASADLLLLQLESPLPTVERAIAIAKAHRVGVVLNPAPARLLDPGLVAGVDYLVPNETEATVLSKVEVVDLSTAEKATRVLRAQGAGAVIVTLGERGALVADSLGETHIPGFAVEVVDSTAAGDAFVAGMAVTLASGQPVREAVRFANAAGALATTKLGAQPSLPTYEQVLALLVQHG